MESAIVTTSPSIISTSYRQSRVALRSGSCFFRHSARPKLLAVAAQNAQEDIAPAAEDSPPSPPPPSADILVSSAVDFPSTSLINYANIQKAFKGEALLTPDYYGTLGVTPSSSYEEVEKAFQKRRETVLQQDLSEEEIRARLQALKVSYNILSSEEERRLYDWSLYQSRSPGGAYVWPYEADITQRESAPGPEKPKKRQLDLCFQCFKGLHKKVEELAAIAELGV